MFRCSRPLTAAGLILPLAACVSPGNDRLTLAEQLELPPFGTPGPADRPPDQARLTSLDRSGWNELAFDVPVDGTEHMAVYRSRLRLTNDSPRRTGGWPTVDTAVTAADASNPELAADAIEALTWATIDSVLFLPRLIVHRPWCRCVSPMDSYARDWLDQPQPLPVRPVGAAAPPRVP